MKVFGVEIPDYQDCNRCGKKDACRFTTYAYDQPCVACKNTPEFDEEMRQHKKPGISEAFKSRQVAGVYSGKGRNFYVNHKGDVIKEEKARPLKTGVKDWH